MGSANINDRSMKGSRDSEIAVNKQTTTTRASHSIINLSISGWFIVLFLLLKMIVEDKTPVNTIMNGEKYEAS